MWRRLLCVAVGALALVEPAFTYHQYAADVRSGEQVACKWVRLAVDRWYSDLDRQGSDALPWVFDEARANRYISFTRRLEHTQAFTGTFEPQPWQQFAMANIFGWVHPDTGYRRFRKTYREVARKQGKTFGAAAEGNAALHLDGERGAEFFCLARDRDQAMKAYTYVREQNQNHPLLARRLKFYKGQAPKMMGRGNTGSGELDASVLIRPVTKDPRKQDSWNPHIILVDEYHAHDTNDLINAYESGTGSRPQPLTLIITTAGTNYDGPAYQEERATLTRMLTGKIPMLERFWGTIYTLDDGDDYTDERVWIKANPNLGVSVYVDYLRDRVAEAAVSPRKATDVLTKNFNVWQSSETRWMTPEVWQRNGHAVDEESLKGAGAAGGLDLSLTTDITALCWAFPLVDGRHPMIWRFFIPTDRLVERIRRDRVPYDAWIKQGWIIPCAGETIDYSLVTQTILDDAATFGASRLGYDPWHAGEVEEAVVDTLELVKYRQRYEDMGQPSLMFEHLAINGAIAHGDNPVMAWMMRNTEIKEDRQGNIMPMKPRRDGYGKRIDGVPAGIIALDLVRGGMPDTSSVYDTKEVLLL